ncbi:MAG TPA: TetR/AcrR family transcriptional regulator [Solirubrobacteraceae bacterium]|jgi:AcrR family transcriptional regulator|nr:TetR/AcrR family transcriptional regulator [Solirubrobacteraceae bacterium]
MARAVKPLVKGAPAGEPSDGRRARGMRSRAAVIERAVQMASRDGMEGLTLGALAAELGVNKSSVFALFGSKEELQLATLAAARQILVEQVIAPALSSPEGLPRLLAIGRAWSGYLGADVFAGGCFLCAASAEMDGRPGPVRDAVADVMREWLAVLRANVKAAVAAGELPADVDPAGMAFRLNALGMAANWQRQLFGDQAGIRHMRAAWQTELGAGAKPGANAKQGAAAKPGAVTEPGT